MHRARLEASPAGRGRGAGGGLGGLARRRVGRGGDAAEDDVRGRDDVQRAHDERRVDDRRLLQRVRVVRGRLDDRLLHGGRVPHVAVQAEREAARRMELETDGGGVLSLEKGHLETSQAGSRYISPSSSRGATSAWHKV